MSSAHDGAEALRPQPAVEPNPGAVFDTLLAYQRTAALRAAIEIELFSRLGRVAGNSRCSWRHDAVSPSAASGFCATT